MTLTLSDIAIIAAATIVAGFIGMFGGLSTFAAIDKWFWRKNRRFWIFGPPY